MEPILKSWPTQHVRLKRHQTHHCSSIQQYHTYSHGSGRIKKEKSPRAEDKAKPLRAWPAARRLWTSAARVSPARWREGPRQLRHTRERGQSTARGAVLGSGRAAQGPGSAALRGTGSGVGPSAGSGTATKWRPPLAAAPLRPRAWRPPRRSPTARLGPVRSHRRGAAAVPPSPPTGMLRSPRT